MLANIHYLLGRPTRYQITAKEIIDTEGQTSRTTTIGSLFEKKENNTKIAKKY